MTTSAQRVPWTPDEDVLLATEYPHRPTAELQSLFPGRSVRALSERAAKLGVKKSPEYLASPAAGRLQPGCRAGTGTRFAKGQVPANKGLRRPGWSVGRMSETQFRKGERRGEASRNWKPVGTERVTPDGYLERKINEDLPLQRRWRAVHLLLWESVHGPVPPGHAVCFVNGDKGDIRLENLQLVPRAALMTRNSMHNYPQPIPHLLQLKGALTRKINRRTREEQA